MQAIHVNHSVTFDQTLIQRYNKSGPRYTSYPTALEFNEHFNQKTYLDHVAQSNVKGGPLSLYFHIPFCDTVCFYCACNKIITKNKAHADPYLNNLFKEIEMQAHLFDRGRIVEQLHWGGGTPTFLNDQQMRDLMAKTRECFTLADDEDSEFSIEIDPRAANENTILLLRELGFNRLSFGVQDFDPDVQKAINRIQTEAETFANIDAARHAHFKSISLDLIYGLPHQTPTQFAKTLDNIIEQASPDRLSLFNYAHMPNLFKVQRQINSEHLPSPKQKLEILQNSINQLTEAGYVYIGMDHFAKPDDDLAIAQNENKLYRNFQGYSTHSECDLIGFGVTSISAIDGSYSQNHKTIEAYSDAIQQGQLPLYRGISLTEDDKLRREIITQLMCHFSLNVMEIERKYDISFQQYFKPIYPLLNQLYEDGLIAYNQTNITVLPVGRLLIRNICMLFDHYIDPEKMLNTSFSKVI